MKYKALLRRTGRLAWQAAAVLLGASILSVVVFRWVPVPVTPLMVVRVIGQKAKGQPLRLAKDWVPLKAISGYLPAAVVVAEDQRFLMHHGFDFKMIGEAFEYNKHSRRKRGASSVSQQTAKNVFLWPGRSWLRKGLEAYFTVLIEFFWSKRRIMEVYLNVVETGPGIYGAEATARHYWGKKARRLSAKEAALVAAVLPRPLRWSIARPGPYVQSRQQAITAQIPDFMWVLSYKPPPKGWKPARHPVGRPPAAAPKAPDSTAKSDTTRPY